MRVVRSSKLQAFIPKVVKLGSQYEFFPENVPKCNTSGQLFLNLQKFSEFLLHAIPLVYGNMGEVSRGIANPEIYFIVECDGHVGRYGFVGSVDSRSTLIATILFFIFA